MTDLLAGRRPDTISDSALIHVEDSVIRAAQASGALVAKRFGGELQVSSKGREPGKDLVTDVDRASQQLAAEIMAQSCPDHQLLGEEDPPSQEPAAADWIWVVDPIDGTTNFVNSSLTHAVSIAALFRGQPMAAAIWIPWPNKDGHLLMHAKQGGGTWIGDSRVRVYPASETGLPQAGVLTARPGWLRRMFDVGQPLNGNLGDMRIGGSACYEQFMVARGSIQYAITGPAHTWDFAAGMLLITEAGGKFMVLGQRRKFEEFNGWGENYANDEATYARIRKWRGLALSGSPTTVDLIAKHMSVKRAGVLGKLRTIISF